MQPQTRPRLHLGPSWRQGFTQMLQSRPRASNFIDLSFLFEPNFDDFPDDFRDDLLMIEESCIMKADGYLYSS